LRISLVSGQDPLAEFPDAEPGMAGRMTASLMSCVPLMTGPATKTCSPADSALVVVFLRSCLTTVLLVTLQVSVVPSAARTTTELPLSDWTVPRS
jgi:hypothetical protein